MQDNKQYSVQQSERFVDSDLQSGINYVSNIIQEMSQSLTQARQQIQEVHMQGATTDQGQHKTQFDLIDSSKQQVHHIVNEYFKDITDNYVLLQSKYPSKEVKDLLLKQIENTLVELNEYSQKLQNNQFTQQDYQYFQQAQYPSIRQYFEFINSNLLRDEVVREADNLSHQTQNDSLPQVKVNHRVVEGLYLTLNEYQQIFSRLNRYASVMWPSDLPLENLKKPQINSHSFFSGQLRPLPVIDEEKQTYGYYDVSSQQVQIEKLQVQPNDKLNYQPTIVVTEEGFIYMLGGLDQSGNIVSTVHVIDPHSHQVIRIQDMNVKRVASSAVYVPACNYLPGKRGYIYVMGGRTDHKVKTKLCERFDIEKQKWENLEKMIHAKARPAIAFDSHNRQIYIFFGTDSYHQNINVGEKYDVQKNVWTSISLTNYLPGFDVTIPGAVQINENQIIIFGGIRDSVYFKEQMYFSRKVLVYNTPNDTFAVLDTELPIDFIPLTNPIVQDGQIFAIGSFMKSIDEQPQIYLDGAFVIRIGTNESRVIQYVGAFNK